MVRRLPIIVCALLLLSGCLLRKGGRIVPPGNTVFIAMDQPGLKKLNETYALPAHCAERRGPDQTDCFYWTPRVIPTDMLNAGLVPLAEGTKAKAQGSSFVLKGGRVVERYPLSAYDMTRDGIIEVEQVKITSGPHKGKQDWVVGMKRTTYPY